LVNVSMKICFEIPSRSKATPMFLRHCHDVKAQVVL
jgi:hypothetical protein